MRDDVLLDAGVAVSDLVSELEESLDILEPGSEEWNEQGKQLAWRRLRTARDRLVLVGRLLPSCGNCGNWMSDGGFCRSGVTPPSNVFERCSWWTGKVA